MITEPHVNIHNGTYLCVFTDNSGKKVSKLVIILDVERKVEGVIQLEVYFPFFIQCWLLMMLHYTFLFS